jgi:DNA-binding GntR family transcriptional regulator
MVKVAGRRRSIDRSLAQHAYERLRRDIISCRLKPGQEVTEPQLAERYSLGKTPIREGLGRLAHERLVQAVPRRGYMITPITIGGVKDLLGFRLIVETEAARLAAGRCNVSQLRRLDELCAVGYDPRDSKSVDRFLRANTELHATIALASGNGKLSGVIVQLLDEIERLLYVGLELGGRRIDMSHAHRSLVDALAKGDGAAAADAVATQIRGVERMILDAAMNSAQISGINLAAAAS